MKVSSLQENLAKGLAIVGRAVPVRSTLPQASHVLLASDEGRLKLVATDLMIATTCWIGAQVEEEGSVTVPARLLTDFVASLPSDKVELTVTDRGRQLHVSCARNEATDRRHGRRGLPARALRRRRPHAGARPEAVQARRRARSSSPPPPTTPAPSSPASTPSPRGRS